jgi:hypothetical protein
MFSGNKAEPGAVFDRISVMGFATGVLATAPLGLKVKVISAFRAMLLP